MRFQIFQATLFWDPGNRHHFWGELTCSDDPFAYTGCSPLDNSGGVQFTFGQLFSLAYKSSSDSSNIFPLIWKKVNAILSFKRATFEYAKKRLLKRILYTSISRALHTGFGKRKPILLSLKLRSSSTEKKTEIYFHILWSCAHICFGLLNGSLIWNEMPEQGGGAYFLHCVHRHHYYHQCNPKWPN